MEQNPDIDSLLVKCLLQEATAEEYAALASWLDADADHRQYLKDFEKIWAEYGQTVPPKWLDENEAWDRFTQSAAYNQARSRKQENRPGPRGGYWRIGRLAAAAAVLALIATAALWWQSSRQTPETQIALQAQNEVRTDTLPDGTQVTLNKHSSLTYPNNFRDEDTRKVALQGEAWFEVAHNPQHPFQVTTNNITIKDIGTSFDIRSGASTSIVVESGAVEITSGQYRIQAKAGEEVTITNNGAPKIKTVTNELYRYYRTKTFVCRKTPLHELVETLNEAYDAHIVIADSAIKDKQLTTTFHNENLDSLLAIVARSLQFSIVRDGQNIVLKQ